MANYKDIHGTKVEIRDDDPSNPVNGQVWYNSGTLKGHKLNPAGAWATGGNLNTARDYILNPHESVFAVRQDKIKDDERYAKKPNFDYDPEKGKSRIKKVNEKVVKGTEKVLKFTLHSL